METEDCQKLFGSIDFNYDQLLIRTANL